MKELFSKIKFIFTDPVLRRKIGFLLAMILVFRLFSAVPIPGVDQDVLKTFFSENNFLGMVNMFSGGGLQSLSIVMLGVMPYITASIIMQVMQISFPRLKEMQKEEGEAGKRKIANISRVASVFIAGISAFGFMALLQSAHILPELSSFDMTVNVIIAIGGAVFLMWIGELISEFGIGNGLSLMIFAGIIASAPGTLKQAYDGLVADSSQIPMVIGIFIFFVALIYLIVYVSEAERPVPINQTKVVRAGEKAQTIQTFLPIKLNQAGVIPIIFAISILMFPQMIHGFLTSVVGMPVDSWLGTVVDFLNNQLYQGIVYFILVFAFTFFYTAVTFDPKEMAENLQKAGNFVPGVRPGEDTEEFFGKITTRVTFIGATFLGLVAVLPMLVGGLTGLAYLGVGGTSLLIVVQVGIDLMRKINAQISVREYLNSVD